MLSQVLLHFVVATAGALALALLFARLGGERSFSLPAGCVVIGIAGATLAHFVSPWATPLVLVLYALANLHELRQDRAARDAARRSGER